MAEKPQQQTLSVRIGDTLRRRLERARQLLAAKTGEFVSTSEIAKQFLESARDDRLEVVDLLEDATTSLVQIRRKGEAQQTMSRAEWTVLAYFLQQGLEAAWNGLISPPSRDSVLGVLDAFLAVHQLRTSHDVSPLDSFYLGHFPPECRPETKRTEKADAVTADIVRRTAVETRRRVSDGSMTALPLMIGRDFYKLLDDDQLPGPEDLARALRPYWPVLWRLAARGHYFGMHKPVRDRVLQHEPLYQPPIPSLTEGEYTLSFAGMAGPEFSVLLGFPGEFGPLYPLAGYPRISEFRTMITDLTPESRARSWTGTNFIGYMSPPLGAITGVWFRAFDNGITCGFPPEGWSAVRTLFRRAWELPEIRLAWDALALEYGEL
jgi:hypothetical protein